MVFNNQSRIQAARARYEAWIDSLGFDVRHVRRGVTTNPGGSGKTYTESINELLPCAGPFSSTVGAENIIEDIDTLEQHIVARRKFYFKGAADIRVKDELYIKKTGGAWVDPDAGTPPEDGPTDFTYRFRVDSVSEQSGGQTIAGIVVFATLIASNDMDDYYGEV